MGSKTQSLLFFLATLFFLVQAVAPNGTVKAKYWYCGIPFSAAAADSTLFNYLFCAFADIDSQTNQVIISTQDQPQFAKGYRLVGYFAWNVGLDFNWTLSQADTYIFI